MNNLVQYYNQTVNTSSGYMTTSGLVLVKGQVLCFQTVPGSSTNGFGYDLEQPSSVNEGFAAGVVCPWCIGAAVGTTPCEVDFVIPNRGLMIEVLCSNVSAIAVGDVLELDYNVPTATATSGIGALQKMTLDAGTVATSVAASVALSAAQAAVTYGVANVVAKALETLASVTGAVGTRTRSLKWVYFLS